jgi:hypothetical protein
VGGGLRRHPRRHPRRPPPPQAHPDRLRYQTLGCGVAVHVVHVSLPLPLCDRPSLQCGRATRPRPGPPSPRYVTRACCSGGGKAREEGRVRSHSKHAHPRAYKPTSESACGLQRLWMSTDPRSSCRHSFFRSHPLSLPGFPMPLTAFSHAPGRGILGEDAPPHASGRPRAHRRRPHEAVTAFRHFSDANRRRPRAAPAAQPPPIPRTRSSLKHARVRLRAVCSAG